MHQSIREKNMLPKLMGRPNAHETSVANATRLPLNTDATPHVMHAIHLPCLCKVALGRPALFLPARANG
jgi:hypothetical protein